ncbi:phage tail protein I [Burkholderia cenocepacia]|uniref:phage tail protein I n=1 Tax=Burkholderia cenocepacia TaxID=95486 RepID=UPI001CF46BBF|nr:phage tail protein I [Burkholderia cenocepacia]MCA7962417.1 phage tail protein I [Burkholderia cenocepacia]MDR8054397.1 phage tail protein I [Burkholderia cenocepacia]MDR8064840.1 phage tail protein I [Burkholderia cenocepacia]
MAGDLLPPNASPLLHAIAAANAQLGEVPVPIRDLMNPDTIRLDLLPWLAWHLGVVTWKDDWPERIKRARVKAAIPIARKNGTAAAVREVVESFGGNIALREWFEQEPPGKPYTFDMVMTVAAQDGNAPTASYIADILAEVDRSKPVRSHYTFTQGFSLSGSIGIGAGGQAALYRRLTLTEQ